MSNEVETKSVTECNEPEIVAANVEEGEYTEVVAPETPPVNSLISKLIANRKKLLIPGIAILALIIAIPILISVLTNTYKTPIKHMEKIANAKDYTKSISLTIDSMNGVGQDAYEEMLDILWKSDDFEDRLDWLEEFYDETIERNEDLYGRKYKFTYKIEDKEPLEKDSLKDFRRKMKELGSELIDAADETSDYDSDDWEDMADEAGLTKSQVKKLVSLLEQLGKEWKNVEVTKGYELSVIIMIDGEELDEPEEREITVNVYKVNGRWVSGNIVDVLNNIM